MLLLFSWWCNMLDILLSLFVTKDIPKVSNIYSLYGDAGQIKLFYTIWWPFIITTLLFLVVNLVSVRIILPRNLWEFKAIDAFTDQEIILGKR